MDGQEVVNRVMEAVGEGKSATQAAKALVEVRRKRTVPVDGGDKSGGCKVGGIASVYTPNPTVGGGGGTKRQDGSHSAAVGLGAGGGGAGSGTKHQYRERVGVVGRMAVVFARKRQKKSH